MTLLILIYEGKQVLSQTEAFEFNTNMLITEKSTVVFIYSLV